MLRSTFLVLASVVGLSAAARAEIAPQSVQLGRGAIVEVGEGCGGNMWRGPYGGCNPFRDARGSNRFTTFECPPRWHFVADRGPGRCFPNRY